MVWRMTTPPQPPPPPMGPPGGPPPGFANNDEKTWALVAHFGGAAGMFVGGGILGWVAPLIAMMSKGKESPTVRQHAINALNFQLTWSIVGLIGLLLICVAVGVLGVLAAYAMGIIFGIIAGVKANEGQLYNYPASIKMVK